VTELTDRIAALKEVDDWFRGRGFGLVLSEKDGEYWAHLFSPASLQIFAPNYGRGASPEAAAESARDRYKIEQEP